MLLQEALGLKPNKRRLIALVGGGGKTSTLFRLASEYKKLGNSVLVTTTTAIYQPEEGLYDKLIITEERAVLREEIKGDGGITVVGKGINEEGKLLGINTALVNFLYLQGCYDIVLVEADGAKKRPLKAPAEHEPVIPQLTTDVIGLIGLEALGGRITEELVHRPQLFAEVVGSQLNGVIDGELLSALIFNQQGLFKGTPIGADKYLILNKLDLLEENQLKALKFLEGVEGHLKEIILTSYKQNSISRWRDIID